MKRAIYAAAAVVLVFAAAEILLRIFGFQAPAKILDYRLRVSGDIQGEPDEYRFWRIPNMFPSFSPDAYKIVCLADSVTVQDNGHGYPDDLPEAMRRAGFAEKVEAFNAGVPEYSVFQGRVYLERELIRHHPDLVTVQFGINDHWISPGGVPDEAVRMPGLARMNVHRLLIRSRVYQAVRTAALFAGRGPVRAVLRVGPEAYVRNLERIEEICRTNGANVIFVVSPYLDLGQEWAPLHRRYMSLTKATGERLKIPVVDETERFRFAPELFMNPKTDHVHFNRTGGRILADAIARAATPRTASP